MTGRGRKRDKPTRKSQRKQRNKKADLEGHFSQPRQRQKHLRPAVTRSERKIQTRERSNPRGYLQMQVCFDLFQHADREGRWDWGQLCDWCQEHSACKGCQNPPVRDNSSCQVFTLMSRMERLAWLQILEPDADSGMLPDDHHYQKLNTLCEEAQERWHELDRNETTLFRFRTSSTGRIWGFRQVETFYVVWWDPDHNIFPTKKVS